MNEEKLIDLHTHTTNSDGDLSSYELIKLASKSNIGTLAITDHDSIDGIKPLDKAEIEKTYGIKLINGIEVAAKVPVGLMHILGYDFDLDNESFNKKLIELKENSIVSTLRIIEQIKKDYNIVFSEEDINELINLPHHIGRPDIAKLCIKYGYAESVSDAFKKYLIDAYNKNRKKSNKMSYEESIDLILRSEGIPVLAHPKSLELSDSELIVLIEKLKACGLQGIEVYHSSHTKEEREFYMDIANRYGLLVSGGSDYHGKSVKPEIELGRGTNNNVLVRKLSILDKIK